MKSKEDLKYYRFLKLTRTMGDEASKHHQVSLEAVTLLLQWDKKWGFILYGDMRIEFSGCSATCLARVLSYLNQDDTITPAVVAKYSEEKNFM